MLIIPTVICLFILACIIVSMYIEHWFSGKKLVKIQFWQINVDYSQHDIESILLYYDVPIYSYTLEIDNDNYAVEVFEHTFYVPKNKQLLAEAILFEHLEFEPIYKTKRTEDDRLLVPNFNPSNRIIEKHTNSGYVRKYMHKLIFGDN